MGAGVYLLTVGTWGQVGQLLSGYMGAGVQLLTAGTWGQGGQLLTVGTWGQGGVGTWGRGSSCLQLAHEGRRICGVGCPAGYSGYMWAGGPAAYSGLMG